ncbi:MAG: 1,4-alpha-glucan branching protein GlgB [Verrucomicrobia bacterium]|nr:1,4-alpha-glucan branching protein GlgB [Verrucomicrobiota bacterium]MBU6446085.1 1,4-alpha-glucan branching protein GlgB [Verrucomicrobiota bacterium]MDE3047319.1 1,4-alpha-glucan branching protein GlgB [Verrucomicrobiota bacterium]
MKTDLLLLSEGRHYDPHRFLGLHEGVIRLWRPGAEKIYLEVLGHIVEAAQVDGQGLFAYTPAKPIGPNDYRVYYPNGALAHDPYAQMPAIGDMDAFLFNKGCHYDLYAVLGANIKKGGTQFAVWAPNAEAVSLVADFNHWDGRICPMRSMGASGIWELFVPGVGQGEKYKFEIRTREGYLRVKSDPFGFFAELRPRTASIVYDLNAYSWQTKNWKKPSLNGPMNVYEVHLGSWKWTGKEFPNYREIAVDLAKYCKEMGFTHVELMPVMEHPFDESWGYQVTGFFAVTSRYGTPSDFQFFVDHMHQEGIGVILDWVPAHFPTDDYSLNRFDGTALYEHEDPRKGMHPHWHTAIFNYGRKEVSNFLIASALFWFDKMRIDGLRVDAVASMLYLDYGRKEGEWIPNPDGSNFNIEAIEFLKHLNAIVHERCAGALMIAEESSSFAGVTHSDGLGFDLKWNMGWMNDTLRYFHRDPLYRKYHQNDLTFSMLYVFSEKFIAVLSHDEVVHGKGSFLSKMPGPDWQKFANVRLLYSYMMCHPGKKLMFMGSELAPWHEWNCKSNIDWHLLEYAFHHGVHQMVKELNHFYLSHPEIWTFDFDWQGYEWISFADAEHSVIAYLRKGDGKHLAVIHNFTPEFHSAYWVPLKNAKKLQEVFNTDHAKYGGSNQLNPDIQIEQEGFSMALAPLATHILEVVF